MAGTLLTACGSSESSSEETAAGNSAASAAQGGEAVAKDNADMQTEDKTMPTRKPMENGTKINMYFGDTVTVMTAFL